MWKGAQLLDAFRWFCQWSFDVSKTGPRKRQITEFVGFATCEPDDLDKIRPYWPGVDEVATLPNGQFIAFDKETRATLRGRLF
ncbi:MAG TPA: hypothetical protein VGY56_11620 [Verrucomicrobiae bacterium]|nr:hypothetical protein [Verrucomicrobiae bacterium]